MQTTDWNHGTAIAPDDLPAAISGYLVAHRARDLDTAIPYYADDAVVTDEGQDYSGPDEIRAWLGRSASEYTFTTEVTGASQVDGQHFDVAHHLEGDFPGGVADLHFRFTLAGGLIAQLVIEP
jgi:ketosteroid isomerase-like protein